MTRSSNHPDTTSGAFGARDPKGERSTSPPASTTLAEKALEPGLYVVAAPIGNLRDITLRALDVLAGVDRLYVEDTRVARKLLDAHGIKPRFLGQYHEHNAEFARTDILKSLQRGESVALMSDAGTPLVSDPGFKLARSLIEAGHRIFPIPGPSALLAALVGAGLPTDRFMFAGFAPPKSGARRVFLEELAAVPASLILYETGPRLAESLADMADVLGPRPATVARELTKMFEEFRRASLPELAAHYAEAGAPKGEIVLVIGPPLETEADPEKLDAFLRTALTRGGVKEAANEAAALMGVSKREAYARALVLKDEA